MPISSRSASRCPTERIIGKRDRGRPVDSATERELEVRRPLADGDDVPELVAVFATPRARFDEVHAMSEFVSTYHGVERVLKIQRIDLYYFGVVLVVTIGIAVAIATLLARTVTRRIGALAAATQTVAGGDLTVRVPELGNDELTDLSRGFNRMLAEVEVNRARVEFLQRMGTWQEMARRLAHEIKNPLTPILLAVEECHRKYAGADPSFRKLLDTTLEIVEEEVGTLRRLVGEFSSFARLPRAELSEGDLGEFLRDQASHAHLVQDEPDAKGGGTPPFGSSKVPRRTGTSRMFRCLPTSTGRCSGRCSPTFCATPPRRSSPTGDKAVSRSASRPSARRSPFISTTTAPAYPNPCATRSSIPT